MVPDIIFPFDSSELMLLIVCRPEWKAVIACLLFHCLVTTTLHVAPENPSTCLLVVGSIGLVSVK